MEESANNIDQDINQTIIKSNNQNCIDQLTRQFLNETHKLEVKIENEESQQQLPCTSLQQPNIEYSSYSSQLSEQSDSEFNPLKRKTERPEELDKVYKQPRYHPYRFKDYRRNILSKDFSFFNGRNLYKDIFQGRNQIDKKRKEKLMKKIDQLFLLQENIQQYSFNSKIIRIENFIEGTIETLKDISMISEKPDKITSLQRKFYQLEDFNIQLPLKKNIQRLVPFFTQLNQRLGYRTERIVTAFLNRIVDKKILPLNLKITTDTFDECKGQPLKAIPQPKEEFWTIRLHNSVGFCLYIINPLQQKEARFQIIKNQPILIELINLHQDDPRQLKSNHNLSSIKIEEIIGQMFPSDIGWIFQYEDLKVKQFMEITSHMTLDQEKQTIISYFESFYYPVIIFSQIP